MLLVRGMGRVRVRTVRVRVRAVRVRVRVVRVRVRVRSRVRGRVWV